LTLRLLSLTGVGIGVGIPVLLALLAIILFCCLKGRKKEPKHEPIMDSPPQPQTRQVYEVEPSHDTGQYMVPATQTGGRAAAAPSLPMTSVPLRA
jgi:hypothetical protein